MLMNKHAMLSVILFVGLMLKKHVFIFRMKLSPNTPLRHLYNEVKTVLDRMNESLDRTDGRCVWGNGGGGWGDPFACK